MDMFYSVITEDNLVPNKRRMHFNAAMLEVTAHTAWSHVTSVHVLCKQVC